MGSKRRIAKHILPIILANRKPGQWYIEPFVGGANMIDKVEGPRIGFDINPYLIQLYIALQRGWEPPRDVTKELFEDIRKNKNKYKNMRLLLLNLGLHSVLYGDLGLLGM